MQYQVGPKGQIVIAKEIREQLGIGPGWVALQRVVNDHVEVYFLPPPHRKSMMGVLSKYVTKPIGEGEQWDKARERAWSEAVRDFGGHEEQDRAS